MEKLPIKRLVLFVGIVIVLAVIGAIGYVLGSDSVPVRVAAHYGTDFLLKETRMMDECAECHDPADFHSCTTCHDDHGAVELAEVPFYRTITLTGDVPKPGFVTINEILPYRDQPHTHLPLLDFLAAQGITDFQSVTLASSDGGFVTIEPENLTDSALLLPFSDGIRFASEDLHVSTWLKGITKIIVVGPTTSLTINGEQTSIGRLLLGPTRSITVQQAVVMLNNQSDGQLRKAKTATRLDGVPVQDIIGTFETLTVIDYTGNRVTFSAADAQNALLIAEANGVTLVRPERGRSQWVEQIVEIQSE